MNFTFNNSQVNTIYNVGYFNPYATLDGISNGWNINYRSTNAYNANLANYSSDVFSAGGNWGIPLSEFSSLRLNLDYENTNLKTATNMGYCSSTPSMKVTDPLICTQSGQTYVPLTYASSLEIQKFITQNGNKFNTYSIGLGYVHDTLNRAVFATQGGSQTVSVLATLPFGDLTYFKASANAIQYFPIAKDLTLMLKGDIAYGDSYGSTKGGLPFFDHYFAGGPLSVRGFMANTLGPRDTPNPNSGYYPRPFGGSSKLVGTAELLFPVPFMTENKSIRLGVFFDAGNVFEKSYDLGQLRYSTGLSARWLSPFGALTFSIAQPINAQTDYYAKTPANPNGIPIADQVQRFQFSFGQGF